MGIKKKIRRKKIAIVVVAAAAVENAAAAAAGVVDAGRVARLTGLDTRARWTPATLRSSGKRLGKRLFVVTAKLTPSGQRQLRVKCGEGEGSTLAFRCWVIVNDNKVERDRQTLEALPQLRSRKRS